MTNGDWASRGLKQAICSICGKKFDSLIPADAETVICFKCDNPGQPTDTYDRPRDTES